MRNWSNGKPRTLAEIEKCLLENVIINPITRCWEGRLRPNSDGYGVISVRILKKTPTKIHRVAAHLFLGFDISNIKQEVCHHCDNPACFNPAHLFIGLHRDNMLDAAHKRRLPGPKKLTEEQVREIRIKIKEGYSHRHLASVYKIGKSAIGQIAIRKTWRHIE